MITKAIEDYLKVIYLLQDAQSTVSTTDLAAQLDVAPASVTGMLKKLAAQDLVTYTPYQGVTLTPQGRAIALRMVRYHRLAERYLSEVLGMPWDTVHAEAEELEHALSAEVVDRMDAALGQPMTDPHGEPIPTEDGQMPNLVDVPLASLGAGEVGIVSRVNASDAGFLRYLGSMGIYPGATLQVVTIALYGGPLTVQVRGQPYALGRSAAEQVFVGPG